MHKAQSRQTDILTICCEMLNAPRSTLQAIRYLDILSGNGVLFLASTVLTNEARD